MAGVKCGTVGCHREATERITYRWAGAADVDTDDVCTPCADGYAHRPVLQGFTRTPLGPVLRFPGFPPVRGAGPVIRAQDSA